MKENELGPGFVIMIIMVVIFLIVVGVWHWIDERRFNRLVQCCTSKKVLAVLKANNIHFGCYRAGAFSTDQQQVYLGVEVSHMPSAPSDEDKKRGAVARKQPKDVYHSKSYPDASSFVLEFLVKSHADNRVVHAEFYRIRTPISSTDEGEESLNAFLQEWIAFFNDHHFQNDGEKQYFQHRPAGSEDVLTIDRGVTTYDATQSGDATKRLEKYAAAVSRGDRKAAYAAISEGVLKIDHGVTTYDATSTTLPPKVSISGNGKMVVHGNVTF